MNIINSRFGVNSSIQHQNRITDKKVDVNSKSKDDFSSLNKEVISPKNCRVDKIELSHKIGNSSNSVDISKLKLKISTDIKTDSSPDRIQRITQKISNNEYKINAKEIASIILKI